MSENIIIALLTVGGTALAAYMGIDRSTKITVYRIDQLEKKVEKHNTVVERTIKLEQKIETVCEDISELKER